MDLSGCLALRLAEDDVCCKNVSIVYASFGLVHMPIKSAACGTGGPIVILPRAAAIVSSNARCLVVERSS